VADGERVLVLAPTSADAELTRSILADAQIASHICADLPELGRALERGVGAILLTDDAVAPADAECLVEALRLQPPWSDPPILLLSRTGGDPTLAAWGMERLGNTTVMERPVRVTTLISALRTALRARRRQYELRDQMQAQALLAAVVDSSADAIISKTLDGVITSWNRAAERLFGYTAHEAIGHRIELIIPPERHQEERAILERLREGQSIDHFETSRVAKDGHQIDVSLAISPIRELGGRIVGASKVVRDITARKRAADRLRESEARFRLLTEMMPSLVWTAAPHGTLTYVNRRWLDYCGISDERTPRSWAALVVHAEDRERRSDGWARALREGSDFETEERLRRHDGVYRWFVTRAVPFRNEAGRIVSWLGITTDIHEQKQLAEALRQADRRKNEFLATLAHELRNPLAPIRNALHVMRIKTDDPSMVEEARRMMERQLGQMVRLVDDLLDVGRITRGKLDLRKEHADLAIVVRNALDATRPLIQAAGHELTVTLPSRAVCIDGDPVRLGQVLANLLNNAAKYMEPGGRIWLAAASDESEVVVSVRDRGIGIPAEALGAVFDMFAQVEGSLEGSRGGLGIGLTLAKQLVELHGGSIEARSEGLGKGSEFVLRLPVVPASAEAEPEGDEEAGRDAPVPLRILVADDNSDAVESMGMMLSLMGNEVRTVRDGVQAVEEAAAFRPDVVLLDIGMPRLNGYDAARRIRGEPWGKDMILVALTGWGQEEDKRLAQEAGFDQHFTKPVSPAVVADLMDRLHAGSGGTM